MTRSPRIRPLSVAAVLLLTAAPSADAAPTWSFRGAGPPALPATHLSAVACASARACVAVGAQNEQGQDSRPVILAWDGRRWTTRISPTPPAGLRYELADVACPAARLCYAVGAQIQPGGSGLALVERFDGARWKRVQLPGRPGALAGVGCSSARACTAVGDGTALRWNGRRWAAQNPGRVDLAGVACPGPTTCFAVGADSNDNVFAERWDGGRWHRRILLAGDGEEIVDSLVSVACPSPTQCLAFGSTAVLADDGESSGTLGERWDGRRWRLELPPDAGQGLLADGAIACTAPRACTAVASYTGNGDLSRPLATHWDGRAWDLESTARPVGASQGELLGIACLPHGSCVAVGSFTGRDGVARPLVEWRS